MSAHAEQLQFWCTCPWPARGGRRSTGAPSPSLARLRRIGRFLAAFAWSLAVHLSIGALIVFFC